MVTRMAEQYKVLMKATTAHMTAERMEILRAYRTELMSVTLTVSLSVISTV